MIIYVKFSLFLFRVFCLSMMYFFSVSVAGLVESALEHIKHLHVQLNMNSLQLGKGTSWKKKVSFTSDGIVLCDNIMDFKQTRRERRVK